MRTSPRPLARACSTSRYVINGNITTQNCARLTRPPLSHEQGKAKKNAWQAVVDDGATPDQAQEKYIALVDRLKESCGYDENKEPEAVAN